MKNLLFEDPKENYDEQLYPIDEQICSLLKERKTLSNNPPVSPPDEAISKWAEKYGFYEDYLKSIFGTIRMEQFFKTRVEPAGFRKHIPVLKSISGLDQVFKEYLDHFKEKPTGLELVVNVE